LSYRTGAGHVPAPHAGTGVQDHRDRAVAHVRHPAFQGGGDSNLVRPRVPLPDAPLQRSRQGSIQPHRCLYHQYVVWRSTLLRSICHWYDDYILLDIRRSARLQLPIPEQSGLQEHKVFPAVKPAEVVEPHGTTQLHQLLRPGQTNHVRQGPELTRAQRTLGELDLHPARPSVTRAEGLGLQGAKGYDGEHRRGRELPQVQQSQRAVGSPMQGLLQGARLEFDESIPSDT
jgi:hypothetical protein